MIATTRDTASLFPLETASSCIGAWAIRGTAASAGVFLGNVRLVLTDVDALRVRDGDVVVCRTIWPALRSMPAKVGAVVCDEGGALSAAATVAREYGVPMVAGTHDGTRRLREGQRVIVDGTAGSVTPVWAC